MLLGLFSLFSLFLVNYKANFLILQDNCVQDIERENSGSDIFEEEESGENDFNAAAALSVPLAAFRFVTRLATGIFSRGRNVDPVQMQSKSESQHPSEEITEAKEVSDKSNSQKSMHIDGGNSENKNGKSDEVVSSEASETLHCLETEDAPASYNNDSCSFKRFDITKDPSDHYFIGANGQVLLCFVYDIDYIGCWN